MKQKLDQYYTPKEVAEDCVGRFLRGVGKDFTFTEPSAGTGVFVDALRKEGIEPESYDLDPKREDITPTDWFKVEKCGDVVIGNPPFGKGGSMAIHFMNHAVKIGAKYIAFINPICVGHKLFTLSRIDPHLWLLEDQEYVFEDHIHFQLANGEPYRDTDKNPVRCSFQIWEVRDTKRVVNDKVFECEHFIDLRQPCTKVLGEDGRLREQPVKDLDADIVFYSHTNKLGKAARYTPDTYKANICRFLKVKNGHDVDEVIKKLNDTEFSKFSDYATLAYNPSLSMSEILTCFIEQNER